MKFAEKVQAHYAGYGQKASCCKTQQVTSVERKPLWAVFVEGPGITVPIEISTGLNGYDAWKNAWLAIEATRLARIGGAGPQNLFKEADGAVKTVVMARFPAELANACKEAAAKAGLPFNDWLMTIARQSVAESKAHDQA